MFGIKPYPVKTQTQPFFMDVYWKSVKFVAFGAADFPEKSLNSLSAWTKIETQTQ
jgi:hypothetical protein